MLEEAVCVWCNQEQRTLQFQRESWSSWHRFFFIPECLHPSLFQSRPQTNTALSLMRLMHLCLRTTKIIFHLHFTITINHCFSYCISNQGQTSKVCSTCLQTSVRLFSPLRRGSDAATPSAQHHRDHEHSHQRSWQRSSQHSRGPCQKSSSPKEHRDMTHHWLSLSHPIIWLYYQSRNKRIQKMQLK